MTPVPDKHVEARMARIEAAVQRLQLFVVLVIGVVLILGSLQLAARLAPEEDSVLWFYGAQIGGALIGAGTVWALVPARRRRVRTGPTIPSSPSGRRRR